MLGDTRAGKRVRGIITTIIIIIIIHIMVLVLLLLINISLSLSIYIHIHTHTHAKPHAYLYRATERAHRDRDRDRDRNRDRDRDSPPQSRMLGDTRARKMGSPSVSSRTMLHGVIRGLNLCPQGGRAWRVSVRAVFVPT